MISASFTLAGEPLTRNPPPLPGLGPAMQTSAELIKIIRNRTK